MSDTVKKEVVPGESQPAAAEEQVATEAAGQEGDTPATTPPDGATPEKQQ